jgi:hypothetical protein
LSLAIKEPAPKSAGERCLRHRERGERPKGLRKCAALRMPLIAQSPPESDEDVQLFFRYLVVAAVFSLGSCFAQVVTIRVVSPNNGKPLRGRQVSVSLLYEKGESVPEKRRELSVAARNWSTLAVYCGPVGWLRSVVAG